jgi:hypothetical protein
MRDLGLPDLMELSNLFLASLDSKDPALNLGGNLRFGHERGA